MHGRDDLDDTIRRLTAFAEVGADVVYAPFPPSMDAVRAIVRAVAPTPVNVVLGSREGPVPVAELRAAGAKRISLGAALYGRVMGDLRAAARTLADGDLPAAVAGIRLPELLGMIEAAG
jgi:2-methylisocitrate lyase-like PEP mutase family enzyme